MSLIQYVKQWATERPSSVAWIGESGHDRCWLDVAQSVSAASHDLWARGVRPGDRVVTMLSNGWDCIRVAMALDAIGAVESPVDVRCGIEEAGRRAAVLGSRLVLSAGNLPVPAALEGSWTDALAMSPECDSSRSDRPALILWTSGTTSTPKGVVLSSGAVIANAMGKLGAAPQSSSDVRLTVLPLSHAYARTCDFATWLISGGVLAAGDGWRAIEIQGPRVRPTLMNCVPYLIDKLFAVEDGGAAHRRAHLDSLGLDRLRLLGCGGAALGAERFHQIRQLGITPIQGYGLTEAGPVVCSATADDCRPGVVGRPIADTEIRISATGEVLCRGPGRMRGYWNDPEATAAKIDAAGWLCTGDIGVIEADGMLRIIGRADDALVLSTGRKIWPEELERRLQRTSGAGHVILCAAGAGVEAIVDGAQGRTEMELFETFQTLLKDDPCAPPLYGVRVLERPLSIQRGELTIKGTVRRGVVLNAVARENEKRGRDPEESHPLLKLRTDN